ncbi:hypothetical protein ILYODFUR_029494 [Ilyodon furcidens]|uniref:Uncharacterized protein n=1 Tax=Ilyodon furcidens TaxID=33524 RepID=A0ABV0SQ83_9TELE
MTTDRNACLPAVAYGYYSESQHLPDKEWNTGPCHKAKMLQEWFEKNNEFEGVGLASTIPEFQSNEHL